MSYLSNSLSSTSSGGQPLAVAKFSPLESLPSEILWIIFDSFKDIANQNRVRLASKQLKTVVDDLVLYKLKMFAFVANYLPRTLTDAEKSKPFLGQLQVAQKIINQTDKIGRTAFIKATIASKIKPEARRAMVVLLFLGADVNQKVKGWTAADYANFWDNRTAATLIKEVKKIHE